MSPYHRFVRPGTRWLVLLGLLGVALLGWLVLAVERTESPSWPVLVATLVGIIGLAVAPWLILTARRLGAGQAGGVAFGRLASHAAVLAGAGVAFGLLFIVVFRDRPELAAGVTVFSVVLAGLLALVGGVLLPWIFALARTVARERAARVRADERAGMAAHLHDTVLQALTLIQKRTDEPAVRRLARSTERELRAWLYSDGSELTDDFAGTVQAAVADIEDRYAVAVELITVGTRPLDPPAQAMVGALREAVTNAARHAGVHRVSVFAEVGEPEMTALIRDRGRGFDVSAAAQAGGRGIADSIQARMRQHGGTAAIRSTAGEGTEVELRMPLAAGT